MITLEDYDADELVTLLEDLRYRAEDDEEIQDRVGSMLALLKEKQDNE